MTVKLDVTKRTASAKAVRNIGDVPAVIYGPKQEPISITVNKVVFEKMLKEAGESTVINLVGIGEEVEVLIHERDTALPPHFFGCESYENDSGAMLAAAQQACHFD